MVTSCCTYWQLQFKLLGVLESWQVSNCIANISHNYSIRSHSLQVVSQLPSLHQLSLRGCPIADGPAYPDSILQQLPGLDVLDSKKLAKSGIRHHSHKAHSAAAVNSSAGLNPAQRAAVQKQPSGVDPSGVDQLQDSSAQQSLHNKHVKQLWAVNDTNKKAKRKLEAADDNRDDDGSDEAPAKKHRSVKRELDDSVNAQAADAALKYAQAIDTAQQEGRRKVKKQKVDKQKHAAQSQADHQGRSFLADVLDPEVDGVLDQQNAKAAKASKADGAPKGQSADSGLLKVIETLPSSVHKSKVAKQKKSNAPSGSAAVELLQTRAGLSSVQVGMGNVSSWD